MNLEIRHTSRYAYNCPVQLHPHLIYLRPRENSLLHVKSFELILEPGGTIHWMRDDFDNLPASIHYTAISETLEIRSECVVTTTDLPPFDFLVRDYARTFPFTYEPLHHGNLSLYLAPPSAEVQQALRQWLDARFIYRPTDTVAWLLALVQTLNANVRYERRDAPGIQEPMDTIRLHSGTCRDYATLFIACARTMGMAARFVSGYVHAPSPDPSLPGDMHAWVEVFLPGAGWRGIDPTYGIFCDNAYVPVAHAVVAESINPIQGSYYSPVPAMATMTSDVRVRPVDLEGHSAPRAVDPASPVTPPGHPKSR
ncbi:transglutaminase domain-containing protein [Haloferula sp. A504]|uniref:transglutaminase family protein n=1 Tax=Haloferula sp. A504 TaxID=3373601 RepID=UPI0031C28BDE|nr:transglutaminase family protein [Verrucomicrobiaceae bacterium E54]